MSARISLGIVLFVTVDLDNTPANVGDEFLVPADRVARTRLVVIPLCSAEVALPRPTSRDPKMIRSSSATEVATQSLNKWGLIGYPKAARVCSVMRWWALRSRM